ncbi:hypothetical protein LUZ60_006996 [Juncus effusus]|nr:hypothetical protein LUZ60_006996 [Juncus effusus]
MSLHTRLPSSHSYLKSTLNSLNSKTLKTLCSLPNPNKKPKVIVISGPTGAGKSQLALQLAKRLNGEIISADSVQVYRGLDIGSAKPSLADRAQVKHYLVDILHPLEDYSAGQFYRDAREATESVLKRGFVPIVTGGTGLYLRWYMYGKPGVPKATGEAATSARSDLETLQANGDWDKAVELLIQSGDPTAGTIPTNNWYRLSRRLEILRSSGGYPPSSFQVPYDQFRTDLKADDLDLDYDDLDYEFICIFLTRQRIELYRSIDLRCEEMVMDLNGLLYEASWLLDIGLKPNKNSATRSIGYRQAMDYLSVCRKNNGKSDSDEFYEFLHGFQRASRNYAKRQMTWARNERIYKWVDGSANFEEILGFVCKCYEEEEKGVEVPEVLGIGRESCGRNEENEMKRYRSENKLFVENEDCDGVLDWIERTQHGVSSEVRV